MSALTPIKSSAIAAYGYDATARVLTIETPKGKQYRYADVPAEVAEAFVASDSKGKAWGEMIRGAFSLVAEEAQP